MLRKSRREHLQFCIEKICIYMDPCSSSLWWSRVNYTPKYKRGCTELTGFMDSPWSGSSFTFPSKSLVSKFTILYLMVFKVLPLSQDLMKIKAPSYSFI